MVHLLPSILSDASTYAGNWELTVKYFGIPGAAALALLFAYQRGWFISGREAKDRETAWEKRLELVDKQSTEDLKLWRERYDELKSESMDRLNHLRTEKDMWRDTALNATHVAKAATEKATAGG